MCLAHSRFRGREGTVTGWAPIGMVRRVGAGEMPLELRVDVQKRQWKGMRSGEIRGPPGGAERGIRPVDTRNDGGVAG